MYDAWFKEYFPYLEIDGVWSILPDTAHFLYCLVQELQPKYILEFGSGVSTAVIAKSASSYGGYVYSLEHQKVWLERTQSMCQACSLNNFECLSG